MPSKLPSGRGSGGVGFSQVPYFIRAARSLGRLFLLHRTSLGGADEAPRVYPLRCPGRQRIECFLL